MDGVSYEEIQKPHLFTNLEDKLFLNLYLVVLFYRNIYIFYSPINISKFDI